MEEGGCAWRWKLTSAFLEVCSLPSMLEPSPRARRWWMCWWRLCSRVLWVFRRSHCVPNPSMSGGSRFQILSLRAERC